MCMVQITYVCVLSLPSSSNIAGNTLKKGKRYIIRTRSSQGGELGEGELDGEGNYDGRSTQPLSQLRQAPYIYKMCMQLNMTLPVYQVETPALP